MEDYQTERQANCIFTGKKVLPRNFLSTSLYVPRA